MTTYEAKVAAFAPRPFAVASRKSDALDILVRVATVQTYAHVHKMEIEQARRYLADRYARYDDDIAKAFCDYAAKGVSVPATTYLSGWAAELVGQSYADMIKALHPNSVFSQLASLGTSLSFGDAGRIWVPNFAPTIGGAFVAEGEPIPVAQADVGGQFLTRKKMAVIVGFTGELERGSIPAFEGLLRMRIQESTAIVLDSCLLDEEPGTDVRPAGLLYGAATIPSSGTVPGDLEQVAEAVTRGYTRNLVLIVNPAQALSARLGKYNLPLIVSSTVPLGTVIAMDAADFVCAGSDVPRFEIGKEAALHFEDTTPQQITNGGIASPVRSLWQTDTLSLRMVLNVDWCLRRGGGIARTILIQDFTSPASGASDVAHVRSSAAFKPGDRVWVPPVGYYEVTDKTD